MSCTLVSCDRPLDGCARRRFTVTPPRGLVRCLRLLAACAVLGVGAGPAWPASPAAAADSPGLVEVESGSLVRRHVMTGRIAAERAVEFGAPDVGIHPLQIRWLAENGARVAPGDRILELDTSSLSSQLEQLTIQVVQAETGLRTAVSTALANVAEAEFAELQKRTAVERARLEANIPAGLKAELEYAKLRLEVDKAALEHAAAGRKVETAREEGSAAVEIARVALEKARIALATTEAKIERLVITAPAAGIVQIQQNRQQDRMFRSGDSTFPGMPIVRLPDPASLMVEAELFDVDDGAVVEGSPASIALDAHPEVTLTGVVTATDPVAQQRSRFSLRRTFAVRIAFDGAPGEMVRPGMSARVTVERRVGCGPSAGGGDPCLLVSRGAIDFLAEPGPRVRLASGEEREVTVGECSNRQCVVESGLAAGDRLLAAGGARSP